MTSGVRQEVVLSPSEIRSAARLISLLRLLLLVLALGIFSVAGLVPDRDLLHQVTAEFGAIISAVCVVIILTAATVPRVRSVSQLLLHLFFDLVWVALTIYLSGGVSGPGVPLLFAIILGANLTLPGMAPYVLPSIAALLLGANALAYLLGFVPFDDTTIQRHPDLLRPTSVFSRLFVQVVALFLVDALGQVLARRLHEQRVLTGDLIDQLDDGVLALGQDGRVIYCNERARLLLGWNLAVGQPCRSGMAVPGNEALFAVLFADVLPLSRRLTSVDGRYLFVRAHHLRGRRGRSVGRVLLLSDETALRTMEDNQRRTERLAALGEMAAGIAHEIRNPLASMRGCAQEIAHLAEHSDAQALVRILVREADRLDRIVDGALGLARMGVAEPQAVDLHELFDDITRLIACRQDLPPQFEQDWEIADGLAQPWVDPDHLRQVLINLVANALDAMTDVEQPQLQVRAYRAEQVHLENSPAGVIAIQVRDNGCGIPAEILERIFTPFYTAKSQGTGLGLALVQRMMRENHGLIKVQSKLGYGTTVTLFMPVAVGRVATGG